MIRCIRLLVIPMLIIMIVLGGCTEKVDTSEFEIQIIEKDRNIEALVMKSKDLIEEKVALENHVEKLEQELSKIEEATGSQLLGPTANVMSTSLEVMQLIKDKDMATLSRYIHKGKGLRFSPYFYIDMQDDQVFTNQEVSTLDQNTNLLTWGDYDGSGEPISLNFSDYYDQFIYDVDFISPQLIGNHTSIGSGNTSDNIVQAYPNGRFIEFHFREIDPQYEGIDWRSLRLVFEQDDGLWYLVGIVHGQWTI